MYVENLIRHLYDMIESGEIEKSSEVRFKVPIVDQEGSFFLMPAYYEQFTFDRRGLIIEPREDWFV